MYFALETFWASANYCCLECRSYSHLKKIFRKTNSHLSSYASLCDIFHLLHLRQKFCTKTWFLISTQLGLVCIKQTDMREP